MQVPDIVVAVHILHRLEIVSSTGSTHVRRIILIVLLYIAIAASSLLLMESAGNAFTLETIDFTAAGL